MKSISLSAVVTAVLTVTTLTTLIFGSTWFSVITGLSAIFAGLWWIGDMEKEGRFS